MSIATTPAAAAHLDAVRAIYDAFGRGDIPAILERLAEDVQWEHWADSYAQRAGVPWLEPRTGLDGAAAFFEAIGELEITEFSVLDVIASERQVAAEVVIDAKTSRGGRYRDEELHLWTFDGAGKVRRPRHYVDTAKHIAAAQGTETTS